MTLTLTSSLIHSYHHLSDLYQALTRYREATTIYRAINRTNDAIIAAQNDIEVEEELRKIALIKDRAAGGGIKEQK